VTDDGVIAFRRRGITIGEAYFDPEATGEASLGRVDLLRIVGAFSPPSRDSARELHTLVVDLTQDEDAILAGMSKDTRSKVRRAEQKDALSLDAIPAPSSADVDAFADFYDSFAGAMSVAGAFRPRLHALAEKGNLVLTEVRGEDGDTLVRHAYVAARGRSFMLYSGSVLSEASDRNLVGRANRLLHWHEMRVFKERGFDVYDFGGLDVTGRSEKTAGIARFKRGFGGEVRAVYSTTSAKSLRGAAIRRLLALRGVEF
jgi:hypothetical protein